MLQELVDKMYSGNPQEVIEQARKELVFELSKMDEDEIATFLTNTHRGKKDRVISALAIVGYPKIKKIIPTLIDMLKDLNWVGSYEALDLLGNLDINVYKDTFEQKINEALSTYDDDWIYFMSELIEKYKIASFLDSSLMERMDKAVERYLS